jgi:hypothetical protein
MYDKLLHLTGCCYSFSSGWLWLTSLLQSFRLIFWVGLESHGNRELCSVLQNLHLHSTSHCAVLWLLHKQLKNNWFCLINFNHCCELPFLNCLYLHVHKTHELCVATYAWLVSFLKPLLLLFLVCWLARNISRAWHLAFRNLIIASRSVIPWETALISYCFRVTSSTCYITICYNISCKVMLKYNALKAFKLLWNWFTNALKSVVPFWLHWSTHKMYP